MFASRESVKAINIFWVRLENICQSHVPNPIAQKFPRDMGLTTKSHGSNFPFMEVFQVLIHNWDQYFCQATGIGDGDGDGDRDRGAHVIFVTAPVQIIGFLVF